MSDLSPNQLVIAVEETTATAALDQLIEKIADQKQLFSIGGSVGSFELDIEYAVRSVDVFFNSPLIVFDEFKIDMDFIVHASISFNALYDSISFLPPRCLEVCVPFTGWCAKKCLDLGGIDFTVRVPFAFNLAATYRPRAGETADTLFVYPELVSPPVFLVDAVRIVERVCDQLSHILPWPLSLAASKMCQLFGSIFGFFEDALVKALNRFVIDFFDVTGGWIGLQLSFLKLFELDRHSIPGTGHDSIPLLPARLENLDPQINSADELEARLLILPA